jgi:hypothetical protein
VSFEFELIDTKLSKTVTDKDLKITHEKKLHMFIFDPALQEFRHEHPEFSNGTWKGSTTLTINGKYWLWVQGALSVDGAEFAGSTRFTVINGTHENPFPPTLGDVRVGTSSISKVRLSSDVLKAGKMAMPTLTFSRTDGTQPKLTPYLGALAHVVSTPEDGDSLIHVHPMNTSTPNQLMVHMQFPEKGDYRMWVQFIDDGVLKVIPLSVTVNP